MIQNPEKSPVCQEKEEEDIALSYISQCWSLLHQSELTPVRQVQAQTPDAVLQLCFLLWLFIQTITKNIYIFN